MKKNEKIRFYSILVPAALSFLGTILVAILQTSSAKQSSVETVVSQINDTVIPQLELVIDKISLEKAVLEEKVRTLEQIIWDNQVKLGVFQSILSESGLISSGTKDLFDPKQKGESSQKGNENSRSPIKFPKLKKSDIFR